MPCSSASSFLGGIVTGAVMMAIFLTVYQSQRTLPFQVLQPVACPSPTPTPFHSDALSTNAGVLPATSAAGSVERPASQRRQRGLVYDLGFNMGGDSMGYLLHGYTVIAVEANPTLVEKAKRNSFFAHMMKKKRLILLNVAIRAKDGPARIIFHDILGNEGVYGTIDHAGILKQQCPKNCREVEVPAMSCEELMQQHGVPLYLKIDIEGQDMKCIMSISEKRSRVELPLYVSFEGGSNEGEQLDALNHLSLLGYGWFKRTEQYQYNRRSHHHPGQTSGPFGQYAHDIKTGIAWRTLRKQLADPMRCPRKAGDWCDTHAMLGGTSSDWCREIGEACEDSD